ncbi:hypothetical protein [Butyrivibrio sp. MC2013]|uniref:hypothetical protein n=1 Tax=Butyrivibrio sp. MC2013 TaxID=1280686 RepID=UPI000414B4C1|nr:hypothetical protein [Butyrivibrio sp. MC2013]
MQFRQDTGHRDEVLNLRCFYLRLFRKAYLLPAAIIAGAVAGFLLYFCLHVVWAPAREYEASSKLYLNFAIDESGDVYNYYNGYTWNELVTTDEIMIDVMDELMSQGVSELAPGSMTPGSVSGITRKETEESITASIPSDIRLLEIVCKHRDPQLSLKILKAVDLALLNYGDSRKEFTSIELLSEDDSAELIRVTDRTWTAVITGAVLATIALIICGLLLAATNDRLYVPEDFEKRYHLPVLGLITSRGDGDSWSNELRAGLAAALDKSSEAGLIALQALGSLEEGERIVNILNDRKLLPGASSLQAMSLPGEDPDNYRKIGASDGVVLAIGFGDNVASLTEHTLSQLYRHNCPVLGIVITGADMTFLRRYYGMSSEAK